MADYTKCEKAINDYISRQAAIETIHKIIFTFFDIADDDSEEPINEKDKLLLEVNKDICNEIKDIHAQPTADIRENVKSEWIRWYEEIKHDGYTEYIPHCKCPKCGTEYDSHTVKFINFCPNCGAKMRGKS